MKPRIFINMHYMEIGGAERALLGLLEAIDTERVDVDLFINQHTGAFMKLIPEKINLLPEIPAYSAIERPMRDIVREGHWLIAWRRWRARRRYRRYLRSLPPGEACRDGSAGHYWMSEVVRSLPSLRRLGTYDLAISFITPGYIVQQKVLARRKAEWIHTDYATVGMDVELTRPDWEANDRIVSISPDVTRSFLSLYPGLEDKIVEIENILSAERIRREADLLDVSAEMPAGPVRLLSVGRYCHAKNFESIPAILAGMVARGVDAVWYIIGYGDDSLLRRSIAEAGMEGRVVLLGRKDNPYPYIKACDIYIQPSRYEGKSVTVREAQILCRPVAITDYTTARSQVCDGKDGIVMPMDTDACAEALGTLAADSALRGRLSAYLSSHDYGNEAEINKLYALAGA